jgi:ACR3 family arsenite efflux pump ArsB
MNELSPRRLVLPLLITFILFNSAFMFNSLFVKKWHMDQNVLLIGNLLLFVATMTSLLLNFKALRTKNNHAFFRMVYGGMMIKLVVCVAAALIYVFISRPHINKPSLFVCLGLYLVYAFIEVMTLMKVSKLQKNG